MIQDLQEKADLQRNFAELLRGYANKIETGEMLIKYGYLQIHLEHNEVVRASCTSVNANLLEIVGALATASQEVIDKVRNK